MIMVGIRNVHRFFGELHVLRRVSLEVEAGEVYTTLGPSDSGESTLLRCVNVLGEIQAGSVHVDGMLMGYGQDAEGRLYELRPKELTAQRVPTGMVFRRFNLFPYVTTLESVVEAPIRVRRMNRSKAEVKASGLLERVGLAKRADRYPTQPPDEQAQRVTAARTLVVGPNLVLLDEPTSALDPKLVGEVLAVVQGLAASGITMLVVIHEAGFAPGVSDTVAFIDQESIVESGSPEDVLVNPGDQHTCDFFDKVLSHDL